MYEENESRIEAISRGRLQDLKVLVKIIKELSETS